MDNSQFENFEKETKMELIRMEAEAKDKGRAKEILDALAQRLEMLFASLKEAALDPKNKEKLQDTFIKVKEETACVLEKTRNTLNDVKSDERIKDILDGAAGAIDTLVSTIQESEALHKVKGHVNDTLASIKEDENIKKGVKKAKKTTLSWTKKALTSIEKALKDEDEVVIHDVSSNEEQ